MKKIALLLTVLMVFSVFSPFALAADTLSRPGEGQVVFTEANNNADYAADFPLSALTGAFRENDDLRLEFPAARLTLRGFFTPLGEWRSISFSDGGSLGGADFDEDGNCTARFHDMLTLDKRNHAGKTSAQLPTVQVQFGMYGNRALADGAELYGDLQRACFDAVGSIFPVERPNWGIYEAIRYELAVSGDGDIVPLRAYTDFVTGVRAATVNPQRVYLSDSFTLVPLSAGRALISFTNRQGDRLLDLELVCSEDANGALTVSSECPGCGGQQGCELHYALCGHYRCSETFADSEHAVPQCGIVGHCISENEHEKCRNCLGYTCSGGMHGIGYCKHEHNWVDLTAKTSQCVSCGYVYNR